MSIALPLGLLGLTGILVLILIYLLKPNYQQRAVSSTYVWKLSLRFKKKQIPISKLRNIILFLCQLLVLTACALILSRPIIPGEKLSAHEKIIVIDASASMRASVDGETRFERAVKQSKALVEETLSYSDGAVTVIYASDAPYVLGTPRSTSLQQNEIISSLNSLIEDENQNRVLNCTYASINTTKAFALAEEVLEENPNAEVLYYTGTTQLATRDKINVQNVAKEGEFNVAILGATAVSRENVYTFNVDVACYGQSKKVDVYCDVSSLVNGIEKKVELVYEGVECNANETTTININPVECGIIPGVENSPVTDFSSARIYVEENDSFYYDDEFYLYGGTKPTVRIQYTSGLINPFVSAILAGLRDTLRSRWSIEVVECALDEFGEWTVEPQFEGFDLYIFENLDMEDAELPTDGIAWLFNVSSAPEGSSFEIGHELGGLFYFTMGDAHPVNENVTAGNIFLTQYRRVNVYDGFTPLLTIGEDPVVLLKNTKDEKILLCSFSVNYSMPITADYPRLLYQAFNYFIPSTVTGEDGVPKFVFDVNDTVTLNARADMMQLNGPLWSSTQVLNEFPMSLQAGKPGTYTVSQVDMRGDTNVERFFVKISAEESNITRTADALPVFLVEETEQIQNFELVLYFAIVLVTLLAAEWFLHTRERV